MRTAEHQALVDGCFLLAMRLAYDFARARRCDAADFTGWAYLALVRAAESFDPSRGVAFSTYAHRCISGQLRRHARQLAGGRVQFHAGVRRVVAGPHLTDALGERAGADLAEPTPPEVDWSELSPRESAVTLMRARGLKANQIAAALGIEPHCAATHAVNARKKLAAALARG